MMLLAIRTSPCQFELKNLLGERTQNKFTLVHQLVRDRKSFIIDSLALKEQDVEIDVSWTLVDELDSS